MPNSSHQPPMPNRSISSSTSASTSSYGALSSPIASTLAFAASFALPSSRSSSPSASTSSTVRGHGSGSGEALGKGGRNGGNQHRTQSRSHDRKLSYNEKDNAGEMNGTRRKGSASSAGIGAGRGKGWHEEAWDSGSDEEPSNNNPSQSRSGGTMGTGFGMSSSSTSSRNGRSSVPPGFTSSSASQPYLQSQPPISSSSMSKAPATSTSTSTGNIFSSAIGMTINSLGSYGRSRPNITSSLSSPNVGFGAGTGGGGYSSLADGSGKGIGDDGDEKDETSPRSEGQTKSGIERVIKPHETTTLARPIPLPVGSSLSQSSSSSSRPITLSSNQQPLSRPVQNTPQSNTQINASHPTNTAESTGSGSASTISILSSSSFPSSSLGSGIGISPSSLGNGIGTNGNGNELTRAFSYTHISPPSPMGSLGVNGNGGGIGRESGNERIDLGNGRNGNGENIVGFERAAVSGVEGSGTLTINNHANELDSSKMASMGADPLPSSSSIASLPVVAGTGNGSLPNGGADWTILETREAKDLEKEYEESGLIVGNGTVRSKASIVGDGGEGEKNALKKNEGMGGTGAVEKKEKYGKEALRVDYEAIVTDPLHRMREPAPLSSSSSPTSDTHPPHSPNIDRPIIGRLVPPTPTPSSPSLSDHYHQQQQEFESSGLRRQHSVRTERRREKFGRVLRGGGSSSGSSTYRAGGGYGGSSASSGMAGGGAVDPVELRQMAWSGVPAEFRPVAWQMLLNYLPLPPSPRLTTLARKRREYAQLVTQTFNRGMTALDAQIWHQIEIDVPRTRPGVPLWAGEITQRSLERILYVWAIRHPASGYVQGINDLVTPFFEVFLSPYVDCDPELFDCSCLPPTVLAAIEADTFWCLSKLLDGIQDNYISQQPGIHRLVRRMGELIKRIDAPLAQHLEEQGVEFMQFAFRWMNCLLMREISVKCTIRMWDTYLSEGTDAFSQFHLYVCSAFLVKWSARLQEMEFQDIIMFLQSLPTQQWTDHDIELLLSEAFVLKSVWQGAENHFTGQVSGPLGGGMGGR